jgi:hypothetical protein
MKLDENDLRLLIRNILQEEVEEEVEEETEEEVEAEEEVLEPAVEEPEVDPELQALAKQYTDGKTFPAKAEAIANILRRDEFFGSDIVGPTKGKQHKAKNSMRFAVGEGAKDRLKVKDIVDKVYDILAPNKTNPVRVFAPDTGPNESGSYTAYVMPDLGNLMFTFGGAGATSGQRKGGYKYEMQIVLPNLQNAGLEASGGEDNTVSDVYIVTKDGKLGIEVKLPDAQLGEPTLQYNMKDRAFFPSRVKGINVDVANLINTDKRSTDAYNRMVIIKDKVNASRLAQGKDSQLPPFGDIIDKITRAEYNDIVKPALRDDERKGSDIEGTVQIAQYRIGADRMRDYYLGKNAGLVQVAKKGLYHLHPDFEIKIKDEDGNEKRTILFDFDDPAKGGVQFRNMKGNRYGIRSDTRSAPLKKIRKSPIDLDDEADREAFAAVVPDMSFPDPRSLMDSKPMSESVDRRWQLLAGLKE